MGHAWISSCGLWDKRLFDPGINIDVIRIAISDGFEGKLLQFEWNCEGSTNPSCKYYSKLSFVSLMILVLIPYPGIWDWKGRLGYLLCT